MMKRLPFTLALVASCLLSACQRPADDHISVNGKIFIFNIRLAKAYYALNLNRLQGVPDGSMVTAAFENPTGGPPLIATRKVFPKMVRIDLQSPDLTCVVPDRPYKITVTLKDPDGKLLQTLETTLSSTLDQTVMPERALVVGNAYDRNPEAYDRDGKIRFRKGCPH
jgi:hypothetical protein